MGRIVISENVSLDGVIEDPTGAEGLRVGGWFYEPVRDAERASDGASLKEKRATALRQAGIHENA